MKVHVFVATAVSAENRAAVQSSIAAFDLRMARHQAEFSNSLMAQASAKLQSARSASYRDLGLEYFVMPNRNLQPLEWSLRK